MSDIERFLSSTFCNGKMVGHLDGCNEGAYVITKEEMSNLACMISKKTIKELLALHDKDREKVSSQCNTLINMSTVVKYLEGL